MSSEDALWRIHEIHNPRPNKQPETLKTASNAMARLAGAAMLGASPLVAGLGNPVAGAAMAVTGAKVFFSKAPVKALASAGVDAAAGAAAGEAMKNISENSKKS